MKFILTRSVKMLSLIILFFLVECSNAQLTSITQDPNTGKITISSDVQITGKLQVNGNAYLNYNTFPTGTNYGLYVGSSGASISNLAYTTTCGSSCFASDEMVKVNIAPSTDLNVLEKMVAVGRYKFQYMPGFTDCDGCIIDGFIAQNLTLHFPDVVRRFYNFTWTDSNTKENKKIPQMLMINYDQLIPHLWDAVLQLNTKLSNSVTTLTNRVEDLTNTLNTLTASATIVANTLTARISNLENQLAGVQQRLGM
jgi:hypothetical protein